MRIASRVPIRALALALLGVLVLVSLSGCSSVSSLGGGKKAETLVTQGESALDSGDYAKAKSLFSQALAADASSVAAQAGLADVAIYQGKTDEGVKLAQAAVDLAPNSYRGYSSLGSGLIDADKLDEAETALRKAIKLNPKDSDSLGNLGVVYYRQGFMDLSAKYVEKAVALDPKEPWNWANLAAADWWLGETDESVDAANKAVALDDANGQAHQYLAAAALGKDDKATALEEARLAAKYAGDDAWSYALLSNAYVNELDWDSAAQAAQQALSMDATSERALGILAFVKLKKGDNAGALKWAEKALDENDEDADTYYTIGMADHALGKLDAAIAAMSEAVRLDPADATDKKELASFSAEKARLVAEAKRRKAELLAAKKALAARRAAAAKRRSAAGASSLVNKALAYVRSAYSWYGASGRLSKWKGRTATVRVSAPGKGWTNIYLYRENNGMWTVQEME